jgi:serine/threonine protein kinase
MNDINDISKRYRIHSELGSGALGKVYLAEDVARRRYVALKVFSAEALEDPENFRSFINEAKTLSAIHHPNIVSLYEVGKTRSSYFIAREFVEGVSLRERISKGQLQIGDTLKIAVQTANALKASHASGIIHRDIKPENIILSRPNLIKVVDFDLAKINERSPAGLDQMIAHEFRKPVTPKDLVYMSPEEVLGQSPNESTDIWHLGVLVSEMVSRRTPFQKGTPSGTISAILEDEPARFERDVPSDLQDIIGKALQKSQERRYGSAENMASELKEALDRIERAPAPDHRYRRFFDRILGRTRSRDAYKRGAGGPPGPPDGDSPDVLAGGGDPQSEPLYLTAQVTEIHDKIEIPRVDGFARGQKHRVTVYLAIQERATGIVADAPSPVDRSLPHELYVSFFASWLPATPLAPILMNAIGVPESTRTSTEFTVPTNLDRIELTVVLMERIGDEVTPIQSGVLTGDVVAPGAEGSGISLRIDPHPVRPPEPTTDGVTIVMGDDTLVVYGAPATAGQFQPPGQFNALRAKLGNEVLALWAAMINAKDEKQLANGLVKLAASGRGVLELFKKWLDADDETRRRLFDTDGTVRLWSRELDTDLPVEFIYDRNDTPDFKNPKLCPQFFEALDDGACRDCENRGGAMCAFDFWAFRRRIERRIVVNGDAASGNSIALVPAKTLPSMTAPAAFAASKKVLAGSRDEIITLLTEGGVEIEPPATNWDGWQALLKKAPYRLLVLLSHTEQNSSLEIEGDLIHREWITEDYVNPQRQQPGPVVLLTGCETARPDDTFLSFVSKFLDKGAAVVVATLALIREDASAEATQHLLHSLREVVSRESDLEHRTVGEIMRRTRCRMLAKKNLTGLNLVAYGDADWQFEMRGKQ